MNNEELPGRETNGLTAENFLSVFPIALRGDQTIAALAEMAAEALEKRAGETSRPRLYPDVMSLPEDLLDILAYDFAIDWWDPNYSLDEKRRIFKTGWYVHKHLGTKAAVEQAISAIYPETRVEEWFEYGGQPYHFRLQINISDDDIDSDRMRRVLDRLHYYKNLRSHNDGIHYFMEPQATEANACAGHIGSHLRIGTGTGLELSGTSPRSQAEAFAEAVASGRYMFVGTADVPVPGLTPPQAESGVNAAAGSPGTRMRIWSGMELSGTGPRSRAEAFAAVAPSGRYIFAGTADVPVPGLVAPRGENTEQTAAGSPGTRMRIWSGMELSGTGPRSQAGVSAGAASCGCYRSAVVAVKTGDTARPGGTAAAGAARKTVGAYQKITTEVSG